MNTCVVGLQFGDEGKGKIVDLVADQYDIIVRYNGGANAGHTVKVGDQTHKFHHIPSAAAHHKNMAFLLASGMAINPVTCWEEIRSAFFAQSVANINLMISDKAHCVMPWHVAADIRKGGKVGTTKRGIGPAYADKAHRWNAIRMGTLLEKLEDERMQRFFAVDEAFHGGGLWKEYHDAASKLSEFTGNTEEYLRAQIKAGKNVLFESANGMHLDVDYGTYPYVTSSAVGPTGIPQSCGLPNLHLDRIIGVAKCYSTRVGEGPFPSELAGGCSIGDVGWSYTMDGIGPGKHLHLTDGEAGDLIREQGKEYGTTTGRPRRVGWFDLVMTRKAVALTGATELALMHADTLCGFSEVGMLTELTSCCSSSYAIKKEERLPGWKSIEDSTFADFVLLIERELGIPVTIVSHGAKRDETIWRST